MKVLMMMLVMVCGGSVFAQNNNGEFVVPFSNPAAAGKLVVDIKTGSVVVKGTARKDVLVKYTSEKYEDNDRDEDNDDDRHKPKGHVNVNVDNGRKGKEGLKKISGGAMDLEASEYQNTVKITSDNWNESMTVIVEVPSTIDMRVKT